MPPVTRSGRSYAAVPNSPRVTRSHPYGDRDAVRRSRSTPTTPIAATGANASNGIVIRRVLVGPRVYVSPLHPILARTAAGASDAPPTSGAASEASRPSSVAPSDPSSHANTSSSPSPRPSGVTLTRIRVQDQTSPQRPAPEVEDEGARLPDAGLPRLRRNFFVAVRNVLSNLWHEAMDDPLAQMLDVALSLERGAVAANSGSRNPPPPASGIVNSPPPVVIGVSTQTLGSNEPRQSRDDGPFFPIVRIRGFNFPLLRRQYNDCMKWRAWFDVLRDRAWRARQSAGKASADMDCPICLESLEDAVKLQPITCMHVFHDHCIESWIQKNPSFPRARCPVCRGNFMNRSSLDQEKKRRGGGSGRGGRRGGADSGRASTYQNLASVAAFVPFRLS